MRRVTLKQHGLQRTVVIEGPPYPKVGDAVIVKVPGIRSDSWKVARIVPTPQKYRFPVVTIGLSKADARMEALRVLFSGRVSEDE